MAAAYGYTVGKPWDRRFESVAFASFTFVEIDPNG